MTKLIIILLLIVALELRWTSCSDSRRENGKSASSASVSVAEQIRHSPALSARRRIVHPLSTLKHRVALVTKPGATLAAAQRGSTHATSIAPPVQGGPTLLSTRVIRTISTATPTSPVTAVSSSTTPTSTAGSTTGSTSSATSTTSPTSTTSTSTSSTSASSSTTATSTSNSATATSTTTASTTVGCLACGIASYNSCPSPVPACSASCCVPGTSCRSAVGTPCRDV